MKEIFITLLLLNVFLFSVKSQSKLDTVKYAIFRFDRNNPWVFSKNYKATVLTSNEIIKAEQLLVKCISSYNIKQHKYSTKAKKSYPNIDQTQFFIELSKYKRQYITVINQKGEKEIWINCFRPSNHSGFEYWRKKIVRVSDGGNYFFNVIVNLKTNKYYQFSTNGIA